MSSIFFGLYKLSSIKAPNINGKDILSLYSKNTNIWAWGTGTLGNNTSAGSISNTPVKILWSREFITEIVGGNTFSGLLTKSGQIWTWGTNTFGQLGDNSVVGKLTPVSILGNTKTFCDISFGNDHSLAVDKNGRIWSWGNNNVGQLGDNSVISKRTPVSILGAVKTFCNVIATNQFSLAIDKNSRIWSWGNNTVGQLGNNAIISQLTPVSILGAVKSFKQADSHFSDNSVLALDINGRVWAWGVNTYGQLGDNSVTSRRTPVSILGANKTFNIISSGGWCSGGIDRSGRIWMWGNNTNYQLGVTDLVSVRTPKLISGALKTFCNISLGQYRGIAVDNRNNVWTWGYNINASLGLGYSTMSALTPVGICDGGKTFSHIFNSSGGNQSLTNRGQAWGWGINYNYTIGNNLNLNKDSPILVSGVGKTFCDIVLSQTHSMAIDKNGSVWCWGDNVNGQLGDNSLTTRGTPVKISGLNRTFCVIDAGSGFSVGINQRGLVFTWGGNNVGQLGDNTIVSKRTPVSILGALKTFCKIATGQLFTTAIDKNGRVWGWGGNTNGQLGDNTIVSKRTPVSILGAVKTFCQISTGDAFTLAIDKNGRVWGWGLNNQGQLGDNSTFSRLTPVSILGANKTFCKIFAGFTSSAGIDKNGTVWCWGGNTYGQLGDNSKTSRRTPVRISGSNKTFCDIALSNTNGIGIDKNGKIWVWGDNGNGELGNRQAFVSTPVLVTRL